LQIGLIACYSVHMVVQDDRSFFKFDGETADRLKRMVFRLSAETGKRVTYKDLLGRALDALERELGAAKDMIGAGKPVPRKRAKA
jgi:hypothetical protein